MILADKRDFKNGYRKHYSAYKSLDSKSNGEVISKRLILTYSVECGLKYKLLDEWKIDSSSEVRQIFADKNHPKHNILGSHNLQKIIKELGLEGQFKFPQLKTIHKDFVNSEEFHQMQRYGIKPDNKSESKLDEFEDVLKQVAEWIGEDI